MELGDVGELLGRCLPHTLAGTLHHHGSHLHEGGGILLVEELLGAEIVLVLYIYIIDLVPHLLVYRLRLHHVPAVGVGHYLCEGAGAAGTALHLLLDVGGVEDGGAALYADCLLHLLHTHVAVVAVVGEIGVGVLAGDVAHGEVHTAHELIHMVEAQGSPGVALAGLHHYVGAGQSRLEGSLANGLPVLLVAVVGTHVVHIHFGYLALLVPAVAGGYHFLDARAVVAVHASEDAVHAHFASLLRRHSLLHEQFFRLGHACLHEVVKLVVLGTCRHLYRLVDEEETGSGEVAELTRGLHHYVDARTAQLLGRDESEVSNPSEGIPHGFHAEHIEYLCDGGTLGFDKFTAPERVAHLAGIFAVVTLTIHSDGIVAEFLRFLPGILGGRVLHVDGEEVAARRQRVGVHDEVATGRWSRVTTLQGIHQRAHLDGRTLAERIGILAHVLQCLLHGGDCLCQVNLLTGIFRGLRHHACHSALLVILGVGRLALLASLCHLGFLQVVLIPFLTLLDGGHHLLGEAASLLHFFESLAAHLRNLLLVRHLGGSQLAHGAMVHLLGFLLHAAHLVCHLHHHLDGVGSSLHGFHLACHRQFGWRNAHIAADELVAHGGAAQELGNGGTGLAQVEAVEELLVLLHASLRPTLLLVHRQHSVGDGVGCHGIDARLDVLGAIGNAHGVELAGDLLVHQFLGVVLDAGNVVCRIRLAHLLGVESQLAGDAHLHGQCLHLERLCVAWLLVVGGDGVAQLLVGIAKLTLLEGSGEVALCLCVGAALGYHRLAHVADSIYIKVGNHTYQAVAPVIAVECHLLARSIFQRAVGTEVDECVGTEAVACPEIGGHIGVGRCLVGAVDYLEGIASLASHHLWDERHVAKLQSCHGELAVCGRHILAGEVAIELAHLLHLHLGECLLTPCLKLTGSNQSRVSCLHELGVSSLCIGTEHGSLCLDHLCQFRCIGGQIAHVVALAFQTNQEVVERRNHLHARGCEGVLTGTLEVEDGDVLVAVLLLFEVHIALHARHEVVHAVGHGINLLQTFLVHPMGEDGVGAHGSVNLGSHDALRHESSVHALLVVLPVFGKPVHVEG